jgi:hypothetical protein
MSDPEARASEDSAALASAGTMAAAFEAGSSGRRTYVRWVIGALLFLATTLNDITVTRADAGSPRKGLDISDIDVFFLDPQMRMNPHLKYAQAVPGRAAGRPEGVIDALHLIEVPIAIRALDGSPALTRDERAGLEEWFQELIQWMKTDPLGVAESNAKNNHAMAYQLQVAVYADFVGDPAQTAACRRWFKEVLLVNQMAPDGSFPLELARTKPYGYSIFQLDNVTTFCQVLSSEGDNLWEFALADGRGVRRGLEFLYPFLADKSKWTHKPDVQAWEAWPARQPCLLFAGLAFGKPEYLDLWQKLPADPSDDEVRRNIAVTQPALWLRSTTHP